MKKITQYDFDQEVLQSDKPVFLDFTAPWCASCSFMRSTVDLMEQEYSDKVDFFEVDVDEDMSIAKRYKVMGLPRVMLFKNGNVIASLAGLQSREMLEDVIELAVGGAMDDR